MKRDRRAGGILAGLFIAFAIVACVAILGVLYVARNVRIEEFRTGDRHAVRVETPLGNINVRAARNFDPVMTGVPIYPGAERLSHSAGGAVVDFDLPSEDHQFALSVAEYRTQDSPDQVRDFYRQRFPHWIVVDKSHHGTQMEYSEGGYKRFIAIHRQEGGTHIALASIGEPASN